jgi:hypothetical protein
MYYDIWQMLLDVFNRLYKLPAHKTSLAQLMTGALQVVQQKYPIYSNFANHARAFTNANNIAFTDPNLADKLNNFVQVAVPEFLSDPIFSIEQATSYENLQILETYMPVIRYQFEGSTMNALKEYIRTEDYLSAINTIEGLRLQVAVIADIYYQTSLFETVMNTSISSVIAEYTIIQFVCAFVQLLATFLVTPIALLQWILTKLNLETITLILAYIPLLTVDMLFWIIGLLLRQVYGAGVYAYLSSYIEDHMNANGPFVTHLEPEQLESLKLLSVIYCSEYLVDYV